MDIHSRMSRGEFGAVDWQAQDRAEQKALEGHSPVMHAQHLAAARALMGTDNGAQAALEGARYTFEHGTPTISPEAAARHLNDA